MFSCLQQVHAFWWEWDRSSTNSRFGAVFVYRWPWTESLRSICPTLIKMRVLHKIHIYGWSQSDEKVMEMWQVQISTYFLALHIWKFLPWKNSFIFDGKILMWEIDGFVNVANIAFQSSLRKNSKISLKLHLAALQQVMTSWGTRFSNNALPQI